MKETSQRIIYVKLGVEESDGYVTFTLQRPLAAEIECPPLRTRRANDSKKTVVISLLVCNVWFGIRRHPATEATSGLFFDRYNS